MTCQIDQNGAIAVAQPPGPFIDADGLQGWHGWYRSRPHQPEERGRTAPQPQAGREPGARVPTEGHTDRLQGRDELVGFAGEHGTELWWVLRKDAATAA
jgi:hypothetical protein